MKLIILQAMAYLYSGAINMKALRIWQTRQRIAYMKDGILFIKEFINGEAYVQKYIGYTLQDAVKNFNGYLYKEGVF